MSDLSLDGRSVVVTGAARGLGAAIARVFVDRGAQVVLTDVLVDELRATAEELGGGATALELDVSDPASWDRAAAVLRAQFGRPDVLVNNAGLVGASRFVDLDAAAFARIIDVNLVGTFMGIKSFVDLHTATACTRPGSIINVSSVRGLVGGPGLAAYCASKFGMRGLTKAAAVELGELGIRVNSVCPGPVESDMTTGNAQFDGLDWEAYAAFLPMRRLGQPVDIAEAVCWLASDASSFVTGIDLVVDGGLTSTAFSAPPKRAHAEAG